MRWYGRVGPDDNSLYSFVAGGLEVEVEVEDVVDVCEPAAAAALED